MPARTGYDAVVRWRVPLLIGWMSAACAPYTRVTADAPGVVEAVLLLLDESDGSPIEAQAFDPHAHDRGYATREGMVGAILGYPQPLDRYGIRTRDDGDLVLAAQGVGLPPPLLWTRIDDEGVASTVDAALHAPAQLYPAVRVPRPACPALEEVPGRRVTLDLREDLSFVGVLDGERLLLGFEGSATFEPSLVVATTTSADVVPIALDYGAPLGFTDRDGSLWLVLDLDGIGLEIGERVLCRFRPGQPLDVRGCDLEPGARLPHAVVRLTGRRGDDGRLELAAITDQHELMHWVGDANDRGTWRLLYRGGESERPDCEVGRVTVTLSLDGPGTGIASFESGALERFRVLPSGEVERTVLFEPPSRGSRLCRSGFAQSASGAQLLIENAQVEGQTPDLPRVWWRPQGGAAWAELPNDSLLSTHGVTVVGDTFLVTSGNDTLTLLAMDPRRPDAPPQVCPPVSVFNSGALITREGDALVVGGDGTVLLGSLAVAWWRLREPQL